MRRGEVGGLRGHLLDLRVRLAGKDEHTESRGQEPHLPVKVGRFDVAEALRLARAQKEHVRGDELVAFGFELGRSSSKDQESGGIVVGSVSWELL